MDIMKAIYARRSTRNFTEQRIPAAHVETIVKAGLQAPSGKNYQPWQLLVIQQDRRLLDSVAAHTVYRQFVRRADCLILVFLDHAAGYHYCKDAQAIGACIENMLLAATALGVGSCWIGEILNERDSVERLVNVGAECELMAVLALGYSADDSARSARRPAGECVKYV